MGGHSQSVEIAVGGMTCDGCATGVERAVRELAGVEDCQVSLAGGLARVLFDAAMVTPRRIMERIDQAGFEAKMMG